MPDPRLRAWRLLLATRSRLVDALDAELRAEFGLPITWYEVLLLLHEAGGHLRMFELAESLLLSRSAATRFVDRMEARGLVDRETAELDRRGTTVSMTRAGRDLFTEAGRLHLAGIERLFHAYVTEDEAEVMSAALQRVLDADPGA
jgi:DNA-binding MarR family transcriptional regulator